MIKLVDLLENDMFDIDQQIKGFVDRQNILVNDYDSILDEYLFPFLQSQSGSLAELFKDELTSRRSNIKEEDIVKVILAIENSDEMDSFIKFYIDVLWPDTFLKTLVDMGKAKEFDVKNKLYKELLNIIK